MGPLISQMIKAGLVNEAKFNYYKTPLLLNLLFLDTISSDIILDALIARILRRLKLTLNIR